MHKASQSEKFKKYLPLILLGVGVAMVAGIFLSMRGGKPSEVTPTPDIEETAPEIPFDQRPYVSLTPRSDGHWLKLSVSGVNKISGAASIDYLLEYTAKGDITQGVPGSVKLAGITTIDRDLLLGSESSGKFRYDEGVENGKLTLSFRDAKGKLLGRLKTDFHFQTGTTTLTSSDGKFTYELSKASPKGYFVTHLTFGVPEGVKGDIAEGPYGVFTSDTGKLPGKVTLEGTTLNRWGESKWNVIKGGVSPDLGVFLSTN